MNQAPDLDIKQPEVALTVTAHEPDRRLAPIIEAHLPTLLTCYPKVMAICSQETHPTILGLLRNHQVAVHVDNSPSAGIERIGQVRRAAVQLGLRARTPYLQLCDFDRALHWAGYHPQELRAVIAEIPNYDLLVLGRTPRAWATHPPYQVETESLFNRIFALVTGLPWDLGAGSRGLSQRAARTLLEISDDKTVGVDAEWPLLLLKEDAYRVGHRACEGLEFETADRFGPEIEAAGGYDTWLAHVSADPQQWAFRIRLASLIAEAAIRHTGKNGR
jgi:hypothetical protein